MSQSKPSAFPLLLEVFREGLVLGVVAKNEITGWADNIITNEMEPDYFFIEVSLSNDINSLVEVLDQYHIRTETPICTRVQMGLIYQKLVDDYDRTAGKSSYSALY